MSRARLRELVVLFAISSALTLAVFFLALWLLPFEAFTRFPLPRFLGFSEFHILWPNYGTLRSRNLADSIASRSETDASLASIRGKRQSVTITVRLIFAVEATARRRPIWDMACQLQAQMFEEVKTIGGLSVQLVYYRGLDECQASKWISRPDHLSGLMEKIDCRMGHT